MVAMDAERKAAAVPPLVPATPDQVRRHHAAKARRELRQEFEQRMKAMRAS
jgi:acyl-CoA hydrolase